MIRLNRLFWKIFIASWLTSLSVILVTVIVIGEIAERDSERRVNEFRAAEIAQDIIVRVERGERFGPEFFGKSPYRTNKERDADNKAFGFKEKRQLRQFRIPLLIYNSQGDLVFGREDKGIFKYFTEFTIHSDSGVEYRVIAPRGESKNALARLQALLFSFQIVLILIGSLVTSFLLTMIVVRPVNRLRKYVQQFHNGEHSVQLEPALLKRGDEIGELAREFDVMAGYVERRPAAAL